MSYSYSYKEKLIIRQVVAEARAEILRQIGKHVDVVAKFTEKKGSEALCELMGKIAAALGLTMDDYYEGRQKEYVDLRTLATWAIINTSPGTELRAIGALMYKDHSTIIHLQKRHKAYIETEEAGYMQKFLTIKKVVEQWEQEKK